jgi:hypothetical protein
LLNEFPDHYSRGNRRIAQEKDMYHLRISAIAAGTLYLLKFRLASNENIAVYAKGNIFGMQNTKLLHRR